MAIQNKTLLKIGGVIILIGLFVFSVIWSLSPSKEKTGGVQNGDEKITIKTEKGEVQTNNFYQGIVEKSGNNYALEETKDFDIVYYDKDQTFFITINSLPAAKARDLAENALLKRLGIDIGQACQLKVVIRVPYSVDPQLSGQDYSLSFCPNGKSF
jgi:hypothetical protein